MTTEEHDKLREEFFNSKDMSPEDEKRMDSCCEGNMVQIEDSEFGRCKKCNALYMDYKTLHDALIKAGFTQPGTKAT